MIATILTQVGLPLLVDIIGGALSRIDNPSAQGASKALGEVQQALARGAITPEQQKEANRHVERMAEMSVQENKDILADTQNTMRAETASDDAYVRRMRPTFGYLMALTWTAQMLAIAYIIVFDTRQVSVVLEGMESLSTMWAVALSVLGLYVYKRSVEKKLAAPQSHTQVGPVKTAMPLPVQKPAQQKPVYND